ncbi:MAG: epoxyqueuosine reductase [Sedimentisphaerales bacterium]|nr:epoxyqueuosine reductase [Sedimentisphaerales bacterium]
MITAQIVKELAGQLGADLFGIAPIDRFDQAPQGFHPTDLFPQTKSVLAVAKRFPEGPFHARSPIPYSVANDVILAAVTRLTCELCALLERLGRVVAVPVPSEPCEYWDAPNRTGRGLLSLKHAGWLAGLGVIGKNMLLTHREFGNRICLGAVLLDVDLPGDAMADYQLCAERCRRCIDACPVHAIGPLGVDQKLCRGNSQGRTAKDEPIYVCNQCRAVCPNGTGTKQVK